MAKTTSIQSLATIAIVATFVGPIGAASAGDRLIHAEDFTTASKYDASFWLAETGFFRNKEAQYYRPANVSVRDGALVLEGRREAASNAAYKANGADWLTNTKSADYTSGSIVSRGAFTYGVFEIVARLPQSGGAWPAIWTVDERSGPYREIDIVEAVGNRPGKVSSSVYAGRDLKSVQHWGAETPMPGLADDFHTYRLEWRKDLIAITIDGREALRVNPEDAHKENLDPLRQSMHLRINLALGGSWGGKIDDTALPARVEVKSIKIWRVEP
ncbi:MAG: glycoside hydrolase family 16 protein [Hyphomicrobiales bacterium]|nr:glycoside hydrolase family 16 protein [Hyphomicrobiales bacterium]